MASIGKDSGGRRRILFVAPDGKRKTIRLGKCDQRTAESVKVRIERLVSASLTGAPLDDETSRWVAGRDAAMKEKLVRAGLLAGTEGGSASLGKFLEGYIKSRAALKPNTLRNYEVTHKHLLDFFGADRLMRSVTAYDASQWREYLLGLKLEPTTVSREVKRARQFFGEALDKEIILKNPLAKIKAGKQVNRSRDFFISLETIGRVLDACPDTEWRLIVALSRFGGLRTPSEHLALRWRDIDWERGRMRVSSPKTEHHEGHAVREVPLSPSYSPTSKMHSSKHLRGRSSLSSDRGMCG
jgi:hypothetical protein